jgi:methylenetetrahydrofolate--tRNA-(uracil-5-)-methyltransferase
MTPKSRDVDYINVIGAGLAGCEAVWQVAKRGLKVRLYEMKPYAFTPAHHDRNFAELVCSNSLRSNQLENAAGLLKEELRLLDSLILRCADLTKVPAGGALAVDRHKFSQMVTESIKGLPNVTIINQEITQIPEKGITIIATGPLTTPALSENIADMLGKGHLYFYDAAAPIVTFESINMAKAFKASRYGKGTEDYINCPMNRKEYESFVRELAAAETAENKEFEKETVFEGCMPVEVMCKRGPDTLRFGPLKPVGLTDPHTGIEPYAVVQLRQDNSEATLYNIVGFQTHLKWGEQKRVFRMIPALENAEFVRFGVMHRNTFINSPGILDSTYRMIGKTGIYFAGQITGVEGYIESTASGMVAGINAAAEYLEKGKIFFPQETATGALANYISDETVRKFQPMNINYGIMKDLNIKIKDKKKKKAEIAKIALDKIQEMVHQIKDISCHNGQ